MLSIFEAFCSTVFGYDKCVRPAKKCLDYTHDTSVREVAEVTRRYELLIIF
jgi:hypothetical protein